MVVRDFSSPLSTMDRSSKQERYIGLKLYVRLHGPNRFYRIFHLMAGYIYLSSMHGTFSRIDHILGDKTSFNKFKGTEIIPCIIFNQSDMKL